MFGMNRAYAVAVLQKVAYFIATWQTGRRAVISGRDYSVILDQSGAYIQPVAITAGRDNSGYGHEVVIPTRPIMGTIFAHMMSIVLNLRAFSKHGALSGVACATPLSNKL